MVGPHQIQSAVLHCADMESIPALEAQCRQNAEKHLKRKQQLESWEEEDSREVWPKYPINVFSTRIQELPEGGFKVLVAWHGEDCN